MRWWLVVAAVAACACPRSAGDQEPTERRAPSVAVPKVPVESPLTAPALVGPLDGAAPLPSSGPLVTLSIDGVREQLRRAVGQVVLVHVWATWCAPCLYELPEFDAIAEKAQARGARVMALAVDTEYRDIARVATTLRSRAPHLAPVVADYGGETAFFRLFSKTWRGSIPASFVFDRTGKVQGEFLQLGEPEKLSAALDRLLTR